MAKLVLIGLALLLAVGLESANGSRVESLSIPSIIPSNNGTNSSTTTPTKPTTTPTTPTTTPTTPTTTPTTPTTTPTTPTTPTTTPTTTSTTTTTTQDMNTTMSTTTKDMNTTTPTTTPHSTTVTTPAATTTMTPIPEMKYYYNYTDPDDQVICVMFNGTITFNITYEMNSTGKMSNVSQSLTTPQRPQKGAKVTGTCGADQYLAFQWGSKNQHNITIQFNRTSNNESWSLEAVNASIVFDNETFPDAVNINKTLNIVAHYKLNPTTISVNNSFSCGSLTPSDVTGKIGKTMYKLDLTAHMGVVQMQGYNMVNSSSTFVTAKLCTASQASPLIPIIVGSALAGMILVVCVVYAVGRVRSRRNSQYQEL